MTKHTPGPWRANEGTYGLDSQLKVTPIAKHHTAYIMIGGANKEANARLIAAAPDLLEALDDLVLACELPGDHCEVEQALPAARAAIDKAVGEQP